MTGVVVAEPLLYAVTDAPTLGAHLVAEDAILAGRRAGRYRAVCGSVVLAASLTAEEHGHCKKCARWWQGRAER